MIYGIDYYPQHEPEQRWATDAQLMVEAGFTTVRLAEFAWARMELQAGVFCFDWLDRAVALLAAQGLQIVLGTPTAAPPQWLVAQYPEVVQVDQQGQRAAPQSRRFACLSNPAYHAASERIVQALAARYGQHPAVIGWQIDNEFGCHATARCFCPSCQHAFRAWLAQRYGSLAALNRAWGTVFWGQEYSDWAQITLPAPSPSYHSPGHILGSYRFASDTTAAYQQLQVAIVREYAPGRTVCHNYMSNFDQLGYAALAQPLDLVAWDNYVPDGAHWTDAARAGDMMRGYKHRPFWAIESPPGQVNWTAYNSDLRPGEARLRSLQAVAHGADGLFYFHWRAFRAGGEQYYSAILPHDGIPGRQFHEAAALGAELAALSPLLDGTTVQAAVAIVSDMDSAWALQHQPHSAALADPNVYGTPWYAALRRRNIAAEFCQPGDDLTGYALVVAPSLHVVSEASAANLRRYVAEDGTLVLGPRSGFKEPSNLVTELPLPGLLAELAGVRVAEWAALPPGTACPLRLAQPGADATLAAELWREQLELRGATAAAWFADGTVAAACHRTGAGETWYVGALGDALIDALLAARIHALGIATLTAPPDVEVCERAGNGQRVVFVLNHAAHAQTVTLGGRWHDARTGAAVGDTRDVAPLDVRVLLRPTSAPRLRDNTWCARVKGGGQRRTGSR